MFQKRELEQHSNAPRFMRHLLEGLPEPQDLWILFVDDLEALEDCRGREGLQNHVILKTLTILKTLKIVTLLNIFSLRSK